MNDSSSRSLAGVLAANPDFRLFWTANLLSSSGVWMQNLAQGWLILRLWDSPFLLGMAGFASLIPTLALSVVGGTLADRVDRRRVLFATQAALMVFAVLLGTLSAIGSIAPAHLLVIILLSGVATAFNSPAYQAAIPDLVRREDLPQAIALNSLQFNIARVGGHALAGLLVARIGEAGCFFVNALTYVGMLYALWSIQLQSRHIPRDPVPFSTRLVEGMQHVRSRPIAASLIAMVGVMSLFGLPYFFLLPAIGRDVLGQGPGGLGYLMGSVSFGALAGALVVKPVMNRAGKKLLAVTAATLFWIALVAFSFSRDYWLSMALLIALGFVLVLTVVTVNNLLQVLTPPEMRGRVMGVYTMALNGLAPVGGLLAGGLADATTAPVAIRAMSAVGFVVTTFIVVTLLAQPHAVNEDS